MNLFFNLFCVFQSAYCGLKTTPPTLDEASLNLHFFLKEKYVGIIKTGKVLIGPDNSDGIIYYKGTYDLRKDKFLRIAKEDISIIKTSDIVQFNLNSGLTKNIYYSNSELKDIARECEMFLKMFEDNKNLHIWKLIKKMTEIIYLQLDDFLKYYKKENVFVLNNFGICAKIDYSQETILDEMNFRSICSIFNTMKQGGIYDKILSDSICDLNLKQFYTKPSSSFSTKTSKNSNIRKALCSACLRHISNKNVLN